MYAPIPIPDWSLDAWLTAVHRFNPRQKRHRNVQNSSSVPRVSTLDTASSSITIGVEKLSFRAPAYLISIRLAFPGVWHCIYSLVGHLLSFLHLASCKRHDTLTGRLHPDKRRQHRHIQSIAVPQSSVCPKGTPVSRLGEAKDRTTEPSFRMRA